MMYEELNTCHFLPFNINQVLRSGKGYYFDKHFNKYKSQVRYNGEQINLGYFDTEEEAKYTYKLNKQLTVYLLAEKYKDKLPPKVYQTLMNYQIDIDDKLRKGCDDEMNTIDMESKHKVVDYIYSTMEYDDFEGSFDNRIDLDSEPTTKAYLKLKDDIKQTQGNINPIIVNELSNGKFRITEGHHRFLACKSLGLPIKYIIDNRITLDKAIELSDTTSKWTETDAYKRGLKHNVPYCMIVDNIASIDDRLIGSKAIKLVWYYLHNHDKKYPSIEVTRKKLRTDKGIEELKQITIDAKDKADLERFINSFLEILDISVETEEARNINCDDKLRKLDFNTDTIRAFAFNYDKFTSVYDEWLKEWKKVTKCKSKKDVELYKKITSSTYSLIVEGIKEITFRVLD